MEKGLVVKANKLVEARYELNLLEQKIILYATTKLDRESKQFNVIELDVNEFMELLDTNKERYSEIRDVVSSLMKKQVRIKNEKRDLVANWVSSIDYIESEARVELEFSVKLVPYLLQLKERFTRYQLKNILHLKNKYSIRVYELLKQYESIGRRKFDVEELKQILTIGSKYGEFKDFKKYVLDKTKDEINQHTDLQVSYEKVKKGRKVVAIEYTIDKELSDMEKLTEMYDMKDIRDKCGLQKEKWSDSQVLELYSIAAEKTEDIDTYAYVKLNYLKMVYDGKARDKFAYLKKSLEEDYAKAYVQVKYDYIVGLDGADNVV